MNRADQAPEPSMEELLASIRMIISEDDKIAEESARDHQTRGQQTRKPAEARAEALPEEDVLDLTDEFVFPEEQTAQPQWASQNQIQAPSSNYGSVPEEPSQRERVPASSPLRPTSAAPQPPVMEPSATRRSDPFRPSRSETPTRPPASASRTVWSRRELPNSAGSSQPVTKAKQDGSASKPASRNWAEDIQMPIPEQGPVSLVSGGDFEQRTPDHSAGSSAASGTVDTAPHSNGSFEGGEAAVAVLAEKLARSTVGALQSSELEDARAVDFQHLDETRRAEVTEKFANAIQRESAMRDNGPLPTLLDEVFRNDFIREQPSLPEYEAEPSHGARSLHRDQRSAQPQQPFADQVKLAPSETASAAQVRQSAARQQPAETSMAEQSLAQAQFMGASPSHSPSQGGRTLEDAVREMLRPLLVQWLNENMPRIIETAIREEIATRGLLPKLND